MSLALKPQNLKISESLSLAVSKSSDLRLPDQFKKLNEEYIEDGFTSPTLKEDAYETQFMEMSDDGMCPTIANGAILVVDGHLQPKHNDIVVARYYGNIICRRIFISKLKTWIYGDNKNCEYIDLSKNSEVCILGVVTSHFIDHHAVQYG